MINFDDSGFSRELGIFFQLFIAEMFNIRVRLDDDELDMMNDE